METKIQGLITNKTLDVNNDGKVNLEDGVQLKNNFREIHKNKSSAVLKQNISEGKFDIDGNGVTNEKDIKLIRDHFMGGKTAAQIAQSLGTTANATTIAQKLTDISNNRAFDFNTDKKKNHQDIDNLSRAVKQFNKEKKANDERTKITNITTNTTVDVDGDSRVTNSDIEILKAYQRGERGDKLKKKANAYSNLTGAQIEAKAKTVIDAKNVDVDNNSKINHSDFSKLSKTVKANDKNLTDTTIRNLTTNKTIDTDGNNTVNQKDLDLLEAFMRGDRGSKLRRFIPQGGNQAQIETRLAGLISNRTVDVNKDGKIDHKDIDLMREQLRKNIRPS